MAGIQMGRLHNCTNNSRKSFTTNNFWTDTLVNSVVPTSKPGSPQYSITINSATHFPTITGEAMAGMGYQAMVVVVLKKILTATVNPTVEVQKNGVAICSNGVYCGTLNSYTTTTTVPCTVVNGDVLSVYVYGTGTANSCNFYQAHTTVVADPFFCSGKGVLRNIEVYTAKCATPSLGNPSVNSGSSDRLTSNPYLLNTSTNAYTGGISSGVSSTVSYNLNSYPRGVAGSEVMIAGTQLGYTESATYYPYFSSSSIVCYPQKVVWSEGKWV